MIEYHQGDLLASDCNVLAHGCNCFHSFGAGIAKQFKAQYPESFEADLSTWSGDPNKLGNLSQVQVGDIWIFNLYTQFRYGYPPMQVDYEAVFTSLELMRQHLITKQCLTSSKIGMPKIGCGLAGGDWEIVSRIIEEVFPDVTIHVYVFSDDSQKKSVAAGSRIEQYITDIKDSE